MTPFEWSPLYETGIPRVDREHRELFRCVQFFEDSWTGGEGPGRAEQTLHYLHHYAMTHFKNEEDHMQRVSYPGFEAHRAEHQSLLNQVREMMGTLNQVQGKSLEPFARFVRDWVAQHIMEGDKRFAEWLRARTPVDVPSSPPLISSREITE